MTRYEVQRSRSAVEVLARSTLRPFRGAAPVSGHVDAVLADGRLDLAHGCSGLLTLQVEDLHGESQHLDRELRNRLNSQRYPAVTAALQEVTVDPDGDYRMVGDLTIHGRTQRVAGAASVTGDGDGILMLRGVLQLDIREFGLVPPKLLMLKVHPHVEVRLELVAGAVPATGPVATG